MTITASASGVSVDDVMETTYDRANTVSTRNIEIKQKSVLTACRLDGVGRKPKETQPPEGDRPQRPVVNASVGWEFYNWLSGLPPTEGEGPNMARHVRKAIALYRRMNEEGSLERAEHTLAELRELRRTSEPAYSPGITKIVEGFSDLKDDVLDALLVLASEARASTDVADLAKGLSRVLRRAEAAAPARKGTRSAKS